MTRVLIVAFSKEHADIRAFELGLAPKEWRYVSSLRDVLGYHGPDVRLEQGHRAWELRDLGQILGYAHAHGIEVAKS